MPLIIEASSDVDIPSGTLELVYSATDPLNILVKNIGTSDDPEMVYTPAEGAQRIWKVNADKARNPNGIALRKKQVSESNSF